MQPGFLPPATLARSQSHTRCADVKQTVRARARVKTLPLRMVAAPPSPAKVVKKETKTVRKVQKPKQYRLYIINDPVNTKQRVVSVLLKVVQGLTFSKAQAAMEEAHNYGRGLVAILHEELAQHYANTINSAGIYSVAEPDD